MQTIGTKQTISRTQERQARLLLLGGFTLLLGLFLFAFWCSQVQHRDEEAASKVRNTRTLLMSLVLNLQQAETAQRGFLLTGDKTYLPPYQQATRAVPAITARLGTVLDMTAMQPVIDDKLDELRTTLDLLHVGQRTQALALLRSNEGLEDMRRIRAWDDMMQTRLLSRMLGLRQAAARTMRLFQGVALLCLLAGFILAWTVVRGHLVHTRQLLMLNDEFNRIVTLSTDILAVMDRQGQLLRLNPAWTQITGRPALVGTCLPDEVHPDDAALTRAVLASPGATPRRIETRLRRDDGSYAWVAWHIVPLLDTGQFHAIGRDVTEDKAREEQLRQSQKMELIGQLTGGIAHDFNNLLTIIMGSLELLQRDLADAGATVKRRIETAMEGGRRAAALTHRLLAFARRQPLAPAPIDPNGLLTDMSEILHRALGEQIALELVCAQQLWPILADGHQLENAILNLAVNARDAMMAGGHLTIETRNVTVNGAHPVAELPPGDYVLIAVTDTGCGMMPSVAARVFEPFFTTKPAGQGTGLGLAQVYGFIKQSHGHVQIDSAPGQGTTVRLYLPRLDQTMPSQAAPSASDTVSPLPGRGEVVLLVEDDDTVRQFVSEVLRNHGYEVIAAENATAAIPFIETSPRIDLLFTDMVLTGSLNGRQLADIFRQRWPDAAVLFTTGYMPNVAFPGEDVGHNNAFISKPFSATDLAEALRRALNKG